MKSDAADKNNENTVNDNATLVEALRMSGDKLAASNATNDVLREKLEAAEKDILTSTKFVHSCVNYAKLYNLKYIFERFSIATLYLINIFSKIT